MPTWSLESVLKAAAEVALLWCTADQPQPPFSPHSLTAKSKKQLCSGQLAAHCSTAARRRRRHWLPWSQQQQQRPSQRERERERDSCWLLLSSAGEAAPSAEERLLFSSCLLLAPCVQPGAGSERWESGRQLLGVTRQSSLRQPLPSSHFETYWRQPAGNNTTKMPN